MPQVTSPGATKPQHLLDRAECRVWERLACDLESSCQPLAARSGGAEGWPGRVQDISLGGLALVLKRRFEPGTGLAIAVPIAGEDTPVPLLVRVVHATRMSEGRWLLGCSFPNPMGEEELENLLGRARPKSVSPASPTPLPQKIQTAVLEDLVLPGILFEGRTPEGKTLRLPVRNFFLKGTWPLKPGKVLRVWVGDRARYPKGVKVRVTACMKQGDRWIVKYAFVEAPSSDLRRWFSEHSA